MKPPTKICILTPGALGSSPRVVKEARALHDAGYRVTVVSTRTLDAVEDLDQSILANSDWRSVRIDFRKKMVRAPRRIIKSAFARAFAATHHTLFAMRGISLYASALLAEASTCEADFYIGHYPAGLIAAAGAAAQRRVNFAFDAEDFHLGDHPPSLAHELDRNLVRAVEARIIPHCSYISAASPGIADAYAEEYRISRPTVVLNVFPLNQAPAAATPCGVTSPGPSVYWFSQTIGPDRGLECAVRAIGLAKGRPHLYLRGSPAANFSERLRVIASEAEVADRVHVLPSESPAEMERLASRYDVGLSSEPGHTVNNQMALGNKLFSFLLAGIPIIASNVPSHRNLKLQCGIAIRLYPAHDADAMAAVLNALLLEPDKLAQARAHAYALGQTRFNWDVEKSVLLDLVRRGLSHHPANMVAL